MKCYAVFVSNKRKLFFGDDIIKLVEGIKFSHCAIILEDKDGTTFVYESVWPRSRKINFIDWGKHYQIEEMFQFEVKSYQKFTAMKIYLESKLRVWYSTLQLFIIALAYVEAFKKLFTFGSVNGSKYLICTEIVGDFFAKFYDAKFSEPTDTIDLRETYAEIKRIWGGEK